MADNHRSPRPSGPLAGVRILDLSRILAGPTITQLLGDLGADVIKIERPDRGDDTRSWGPPFLEGASPDNPGWSSYFLCANRNKRSLALDIARPEGQAIIRQLAGHSDVLVENFKVGGLARYGLSYGDLADDLPELIYCSITGFGQTGPLAPRAGYDAMVQAMGGIMSLTGEPDGEPVKVGVGIADMVCGLYAGIAILAALHHRERTGEGQHIDASLFDTQLAWLANEGVNYLTSGEVPKRRGNAHPNIVPYQVFPASDGHFMLAVGNDGQFTKFCRVAGVAELANDPRFATNPARIANREALIPLLRARTALKSRTFWIETLGAAGVPCGAINNVAEAFAEPQAVARGDRLTMHDSKIAGGTADLIANPLKLSETPVDYRQFPPELGEHTDQVLREVLAMTREEINALKSAGVVRGPASNNADEEDS